MIVEKIKKPVSLTAENQLGLHFIGTGSAFTKKNYQNNLIVIKNNAHVVVDFGTKASQGCYEKGIKVTDLHAFLITHQHADHIGSLEEAALMGRYISGKKPDLIIPKKLKTTLWNTSLKGGLAWNEDPPVKIEDVFTMHYAKKCNKCPREAYELNYKGIDLKIFKTNHIPGTAKTLEEAAWASGVLIDECVLFTADTKFDLDLLESFEKIFHPELIIHDCQFFTGGVHAGYDELKTLSPELKNKMLLTHYGDNWESFDPKADGFLGFTFPDLIYKLPL